MNSVALQSLSTLASLATVVQAVPVGDGGENGGVELIRAPFAMLADMLEKFPPQNLVRRCLRLEARVVVFVYFAADGRIPPDDGSPLVSGRCCVGLPLAR